MSIAFNAAPFDGPKTNIDRRKKNKTIKREREQANKVSDMISKIHNNEDNDNSDLSDFNPPPKPELNIRHNNVNHFQSINDTENEEDKTTSIDNITPENYNKIENSYTKENENSMNNVAPYYNNMSISNDTSKDDLLKKINYMIHLLEEQ